MWNHRFDVLALALVPLAAAAAREPVLTVRVYDYAGASAAEWQAASAVAHEVLLQAGIGTAWILCRPGNFTAQAVGAGDVFLRLLPHSMERDYSPSALGHTLLSGNNGPASQVYVFFDRTVEYAGHRGISPARLLGYVMAHELGHALMGSANHSQCGVMRQIWSKAEFDAIETGVLAFTSREAKKLAAGLTVRMADAVGAVAAAATSRDRSVAPPAATTAGRSARAELSYR